VRFWYSKHRIKLTNELVSSLGTSFTVYLHITIKLSCLNDLIIHIIIHHLQFPELQHERNHGA
jgi:hypothetical protein